MAAPVVAAFLWAWRAWSAYEATMSAVEFAEMTAEMARKRESILATMRETIEKMRDEIDIKSSTFASADHGGNHTVSRRSGEGSTYRAYIERKLPFRPAISVVCRTALAMPITVPRRIRRRIPGDMVETTIEVTLKQLTASLMFEGIDDALAWKSPIKAEPCYNASTRAAYVGRPSTRPQRISEEFPFWPRPRGSLAPDMVIVEYRQQSFEVPNVFAAVEVKFPGDWIQSRQIDDYATLMASRDKVALLRVPEDCTTVPAATGNRETDRPGRRGPTRK